MIAGIGLGELREFSGRMPVESAAIDDDAADRDAVAGVLEALSGLVSARYSATSVKPWRLRKL